MLSLLLLLVLAETGVEASAKHHDVYPVSYPDLQ